MKPSIQTFLKELYEIDPDLKSHESDLVPLIEKLLAEDPGQAPDQAFVQRLRMQLTERASQLSPSTMTSHSPWQNFLYALSGAVAVAVLLPVAYLGFQQGKQDAGTPLFGYKVEETGNSAFGSLNDLAMGGDGGMGGRSQSGGGGGGIPAPQAPVSADAESMDSKMIAPWPITQFEYTYDGELPELSPEVDVLKRTPNANRIPLSSLANQMNLGSIDLRSFSGMNLETVSFYQNVNFGYQMYVSLRDATVGINAQWDKWPMSQCQTEDCFRREQTKITDIPADDDLIGIARQFATEHGIDLTGYGTPEVDKLWKVEYDRQTDKAMAWVPDVQRVIFPFLVDGEPVFDQGGQKSGISIGVNVKHKRVSDVYGIMDRTYETSSYKGVTDPAAIKNYLSKVDNFYIDPAASQPTDMKKVTVNLNAPQVGYAMFYRWKDNQNQELLIPSLIFTVKDAPNATDMYYRSTVIVPLAQEMISELNNQGPVMPLMREGVVDDAATSSVSE